MRATRQVAFLGCVWLCGSACNLVVGIGEPSDRVDGGADRPEALPNDGGGEAEAIDGSLGPDATPAVVAFRSESFVSVRGGQIDVPKPGFVVDRDLMWMTLYTDLQSTKVTAPEGWMLHSERPNAVNNFHAWWYYKFATASEPSEYTFSFTQTTTSTAVIVAYSGVDTREPFDNGTISDTHLSPCVAPSIEARTGSGLLFVASFSHDTANTWSPLDTVSHSVAYDGVFVADFPQVGAAASGPKSVACTPAGDGAVVVFGLRPANP